MEGPYFWECVSGIENGYKPEAFINIAHARWNPGDEREVHSRRSGGEF